MKKIELALDRGLPVEIMNDFDTTLLYGQLTRFSSSALTVRQIPGEACFPVIVEGDFVMVRGYDEQIAPVIFLGNITRSSGLECSVGELKLIPYHSQRKRVRYPLCPPCGIDTMDDTRLDMFHPGLLLNISSGGACIVSGCAYTIGQALCLLTGDASEDERAYFRCRVVRATPRRGNLFEYGLSFIELNREQRSSLTRTIEGVRDETRRRLPVLNGG